MKKFHGLAPHVGGKEDRRGTYREDIIEEVQVGSCDGARGEDESGNEQHNCTRRSHPSCYNVVNRVSLQPAENLRHL